MWIRLHLYDTGEIIMAQTENILTISEIRKGETVVSFIGDAYKYITVKESMDEIGKIITYGR